MNIFNNTLLHKTLLMFQLIVILFFFHQKTYSSELSYKTWYELNSFGQKGPLSLSFGKLNRPNKYFTFIKTDDKYYQIVAENNQSCINLKNNTDNVEIHCKSSSYKYNFCSGTNKQPSSIVLEKQISNTDCQYNKNYGIKDNGVWVDNGCEGDFILVYKTDREVEINLKSCSHSETQWAIESSARKKDHFIIKSGDYCLTNTNNNLPTVKTCDPNLNEQLFFATPIKTRLDPYANVPLLRQGFGANTVGGSFGRILVVRSLEDSLQPGTLRWAINQKGPRIVKFRVSGIIKLTSPLAITNPFITIDGDFERRGKTNGITLRDHTLSIKTNDVIVRYIRVRLGDERILKENEESDRDRPEGSNNLDCINIDESKNVIIDHVSASWSADEIFSVTNSENITIQWSLISEPLSNPELHPYGDSHAYGSNNSASTITYHHNIFLGYIMRGPQLEANDTNDEQGYDVKFEVYNNIMYGYGKSGTRFSPGFEKESDKVDKIKFFYHIVNNYYLKPLQSDSVEIEAITKYDPVDNVKVFIKGNLGTHRLNDQQSEYDLVFAECKEDRKSKIIECDHLMKQISKSPLFPISSLDDTKNLINTIPNSVGAVGKYIVRDKIDSRVIDLIKRSALPEILKSQNMREGWDPNRHFDPKNEEIIGSERLNKFIEFFKEYYANTNCTGFFTQYSEIYPGTVVVSSNSSIWNGFLPLNKQHQLIKEALDEFNKEYPTLYKRLIMQDKERGAFGIVLQTYKQRDKYQKTYKKCFLSKKDDYLGVANDIGTTIILESNPDKKSIYKNYFLSILFHEIGHHYEDFFPNTQNINSKIELVFKKISKNKLWSKCFPYGLTSYQEYISELFSMWMVGHAEDFNKCMSGRTIGKEESRRLLKEKDIDSYNLISSILKENTL